MSDAYAWEYDGSNAMVRTGECWICGRKSDLEMPQDAWIEFYCNDVHPATAWPESTVEQQVLLMSGTHLKCWDKEFPAQSTSTI